MNYVLKIPLAFAAGIPLATVSEMLAQVAARGGDGTKPAHLPTLKNTRSLSLNRLQGDFDRGHLRAVDVEYNAVTTGDVRFLFVQPPDLHAWATRNGDSFDIQSIAADHHIETRELRATVWTPDYDALVRPAPNEQPTETPAQRRAKHDMHGERGARLQILEAWSDIEKLHPAGANGREVLRIIKRRAAADEKIPTLKTVQNKIILLWNEGLIP